MRPPRKISLEVWEPLNFIFIGRMQSCLMYIISRAVVYGIYARMSCIENSCRCMYNICYAFLWLTRSIGLGPHSIRSERKSPTSAIVFRFLSFIFFGARSVTWCEYVLRCPLWAVLGCYLTRREDEDSLQRTPDLPPFISLRPND